MYATVHTKQSRRDTFAKLKINIGIEVLILEGKSTSAPRKLM